MMKSGSIARGMSISQSLAQNCKVCESLRPAPSALSAGSLDEMAVSDRPAGSGSTRPPIPLTRVMPSIVVCLIFVAAGGGSLRTHAAEPAARAEGLDVAAAFVARHCAACHGIESPKGDAILVFPTEDGPLRRDRQIWETAIRRTVAGEMPPADQPRPAPAEIEAFAAAVRGRLAAADRRAPPDPGRVTMRRLNRQEYRNTVRDLLGIDFDPTDDFPGDEIAHGFDTVGDALALPPLLLERYIDAAEAAMQRAIPVPPLAPKKRWWKSRYSQPGVHTRPDLLVGVYRRFTTASDDAIEVGPIRSTLDDTWEPEGEYECVTRLYAAPDVPRPLEITILAAGAKLAEPDPPERLAHLAGMVPTPARLLHKSTISGTSPETADTIRFSIAPRDCGQQIVVAVAKPPADVPPTVIFVEGIGIDGPRDSRPTTQKRLLACDGDLPETRSREVLGRFLRRAWRRPVESTALDRHVDFIAAETAAGSSWEAAMQRAMQAALLSPRFLFRVESDDAPTATAPQPLDAFQLASRLSYFLWSSMPDDSLLAHAESGQLGTDIAGEVRRMLADPRAVALVDGFAIQWLQLRRLDFISPDGGRFPSFDNTLRAAMLRETQLFVEVIIREDRSLLELLDADFTFVDGRLAKHYGLEAAYATAAPPVPANDRDFAKRVAAGADFRRVPLVDRSRGGILSHASILTATSNPTRTSPVKRGRWVLEQILGEPPPPPPPDVPELSEDAAGPVASASLRERMELHRRDSACAGCHARMDAIGFALENYDAIGGFRTADGSAPVDAAGEFPDGTSFSGPAGLKDVLLERRRDFLRTFAENMLVYAIGRGPEPADTPLLDGIVDRLAAEGYRFSVLVTAIAESDAFRMRRGGGTE